MVDLASSGVSMMPGLHVCPCGEETTPTAYHWLVVCPLGPSPELRAKAKGILMGIGTDLLLPIGTTPQVCLSALQDAACCLCDRPATPPTPEQWVEAVLVASGGMPHPGRETIATLAQTLAAAKSATAGHAAASQDKPSAPAIASGKGKPESGRGHRSACNR